MIRDFFKLLFFLALAYAGYQLYSTGRVSNPFGGGSSAFSSSRTRDISSGEQVDLAKHAMKNGVTLYYFTLRSNIACKMLDPQIAQYVADTPGAGLRKIEIGALDSPVAKQHGIKSVPQVWVARPQGPVSVKLVSPGIGAIDAAVKPILPRTK